MPKNILMILPTTSDTEEAPIGLTKFAVVISPPFGGFGLAEQPGKLGLAWHCSGFGFASTTALVVCAVKIQKQLVKIIEIKTMAKIFFIRL